MGTRLGTARLIIRTFEDRDADAWIAMFSDPEVVRFLGPPRVPTMQTFQGVIESRQAMERDIGYAMWAVEDRMTGGFIGQCGLRPASSMDKDAGSEIDLGYHFVTAGWNKGYATEAAVAVVAHGFEAVGLESIMAVAVPENVGSWRVMEKAGMRYSRLVDLYGFHDLKQTSPIGSGGAPQRSRRGWRGPVPGVDARGRCRGVERAARASRPGRTWSMRCDR